MAVIELPYGEKNIRATVPDGRLRGVLTPAHPPLNADGQEACVQKALAHPIGTERLCDLARGKRHILIITSDHTRPVPSRITMPLLLDEVRRNNPDARVTVLIATGMHRATTERELRARFGDAIVDREEIVVHRADADEEMVFMGRLPSGGELWLNRLVGQAELVVSEGFIEAHFFAGFSGGRKSILPGVASRKTVLYNHNAAFIKSPCARQGILDGNPIHQDMIFAARQAKLAFVLNVILDADKRIFAAFAGDAEQAHREGCALSARITSVAAVEADIVITSNGGYPLDQNVYQCVKAMTAAESCVRPGGTIILCAALGDGHGGEDFFRWFADRPNAAHVARDIESIPAADTRMDQWEAQILARVLQKAECIFVTGGENRPLIEAMHMRWAPDADAAMRMAEKRLGENASVAVIPDGVGVIVTEE